MSERLWCPLIICPPDDFEVDLTEVSEEDYYEIPLMVLETLAAVSMQMSEQNNEVVQCFSEMPIKWGTWEDEEA